MGLHTYVHPENLAHNTSQHGLRAAIRRPSATDSTPGLEPYKNLSSKPNTDLKRRNKSKEKFDFDENNAQIFRITLDQPHLQSRLYFKDYHDCFIFSLVAFSCFLLHQYLGVSQDHGSLANGSFVPVIFALVGLCKVFISLTKLSLEKSASKSSEKQLSMLFGVLGFVFGITICFRIFPFGIDFKLGLIDGLWSIFVSSFMGCIAGFLYMPAGKNARSFWLGTDQIRSNLSIISCGWFSRMILYANYIVVVFTAMLWINPFADILVNKNINGGKDVNGTNGAEKLVGNVGLSPLDFGKVRLCCLLMSGFLQIAALRPNLQMFLNEAVLSWYQRLHASKVPDLDFSRAKVFLHNHYLCLAICQFFAPPLLLFLFLGLSQVDSNSCGKLQLMCGSLPCSDFIGEMALFMSWWVVFVWAVFTSLSLLFYRRGILYVS